MFGNQQVFVVNGILDGGGVCLLPTDTVYGLFASTRTPRGVERICNIKGRELSKPIAMLFCSTDSALSFLKNPSNLIDEQVLILQGKNIVAALDTGSTVLIPLSCPTSEYKAPFSSGFAGIRVPKAPLIQDVIRFHGAPLLGTSANLSGDASVATFTSINHDVLKQVDLAVNLDEGMNGLPSTIVRFGLDGCKVLREGACPSGSFSFPVTSGTH